MFIAFYIPGARELFRNDRPAKNVLRRAARCRDLLPCFQLTGKKIWLELDTFRKSVTPSDGFSERQRGAIAIILRSIGLCLLILLPLLAVDASLPNWPQPSPAARAIAAVSGLLLGSAILAVATRVRTVRADCMQVRMAWRYRLQAAGILGLLLVLFSAALIPAVLTAKGQSSSLVSTLAVLPFFGVAWWFAPKLSEMAKDRLERASRLLLPAARAVRSRDRRRPILLLRSFEDDTVLVGLQKTSAEERHIIRFEVLIADNLTRYGPPIAIAQPKYLATPGAAKEHLPEDAWRQRVLEWMRDALAIVIVVGATPGVLWEIEQVVKNNYVDKTILLIPPGGIGRSEWQGIVRIFRGTQWHAQMASAEIDRALAAISLSTGDFVVFTSQARLEIDYSLALDFAAYGTLCWPSAIRGVSGA